MSAENERQGFPPAVKAIWVCPVCQSAIVGTYNVDPMRKKCSKTWHKDVAERVEYIWAPLAVEAVALEIRNGHPDDGSDCDQAVRQDAEARVVEAVNQYSSQRSNAAPQPGAATPSERRRSDVEGSGI